MTTPNNPTNNPKIQPRPTTATVVFYGENDAFKAKKINIDDTLVQLADILFGGDSEIVEVEIKRPDGIVVYFGIRPHDPAFDAREAGREKSERGEP